MDESPIPILTKGEWACLREAARHRDKYQIADVTGYAPGTVEVYLSSAARKLKANNRRHAIQKAQQEFPGAFSKAEVGFSAFEPDGRSLLKLALSRLPWPWPTMGKPSNDRTITDKAVQVAIAAFILMVGAALYLAILALLSSKF